MKYVYITIAGEQYRGTRIEKLKTMFRMNGKVFRHKIKDAEILNAKGEWVPTIDIVITTDEFKNVRYDECITQLK